MKLNKEIKASIDGYFDNITAEKLYNLSVSKYGLLENWENQINDD